MKQLRRFTDGHVATDDNFLRRVVDFLPRRLLIMLIPSTVVLPAAVIATEPLPMFIKTLGV